MNSQMQRRNRRLVVGLVAVVAGMTGLSFASVPLYDLFCRVTGYGGTTQVADATADRVLDRTITVRFNADTNRDLPWEFRPETREMTVKIGEGALAYYKALNTADRATFGQAVYNVTPLKAGAYFNKIHCFCFEEQKLEAGQSMDMPVYFFVDPAMADDPNLDDVKTITLSYTFFRSHTDGERPQVSENNHAPAAPEGSDPARREE